MLLFNNFYHKVASQKMEAKKDKIALFFNSERGVSVYKNLRKIIH